MWAQDVSNRHKDAGLNEGEWRSDDTVKTTSGSRVTGAWDGAVSAPGTVWLWRRNGIWIDIEPASRRIEVIATGINWNDFGEEVDVMSYNLTFMDE